LRQALRVFLTLRFVISPNFLKKKGYIYIYSYCIWKFWKIFILQQ